MGNWLGYLLGSRLRLADTLSLKLAGTYTCKSADKFPSSQLAVMSVGTLS